MKNWRVFITPAAERSAKKLPKEISRFVLEEFPNLVGRNPFVGDQLSGPLDWLRSFHFSSRMGPYRIAYSLDSKTNKIIIHYAGYRSGFYEKLKQALAG